MQVYVHCSATANSRVEKNSDDAHVSSCRDLRTLRLRLWYKCPATDEFCRRRACACGWLSSGSAPELRRAAGSAGIPGAHTRHTMRKCHSMQACCSTQSSMNVQNISGTQMSNSKFGLGCLQSVHSRALQVRRHRGQVLPGKGGACREPAAAMRTAAAERLGGGSLDEETPPTTPPRATSSIALGIKCSGGKLAFTSTT